MDYCLSNHTICAPQPLPSALKPDSLRVSDLGRRIACARPRLPRRRPLAVTAGPSHCESSSLNTPLVPRSAVGKYLSRVLQNQRQLFHVAVSEELKLLADDRDSAVARMVLSDGSDEACLHRRIVELKERDCRNTIEDVMYMLILFKFSDIKVQLVPKLSRCIYNGRLEIWPAKDWELESIYSYDVLEMIKEHVYAVTGLRPKSSVTDHWATTQVCLWHLSNIYAASILYGYFLKSASTRYRLEQTLSLSDSDQGILRNSLQPSKTWPYGWNNLVLGKRGNETEPSPLDQTSTKLSCYMMGFDSETLRRCAKVRSTVATELIEKQTIALFGDRRSLVSTGKEMGGQVIRTSFSSLKRLVLEAVAFGSFLWDIEEHVDSVYSIRGR
ncbi:UV-B-induced protein At3g17800, chloroplastic-like isoform X1 [Punica granatum]|uniref:UV-B-induced protein At3g17800, chloroplastic-like isoform X1 n=1 Tax=Punica granatum TaxID=22663 RepID=A0A218VQZ3_PUNGR|nr:UV-B-induced protein At3g17800, chloroplastic-like isoform X1 [Punica granatum]OWM62766.1 hypothetical protein CDL15_Pgr020060 [Punica granatum]